MVRRHTAMCGGAHHVLLLQLVEGVSARVSGLLVLCYPPTPVISLTDTNIAMKIIHVEPVTRDGRTRGTIFARLISVDEILGAGGERKTKLRETVRTLLAAPGAPPCTTARRPATDPAPPGEICSHPWRSLPQLIGLDDDAAVALAPWRAARRALPDPALL